MMNNEIKCGYCDSPAITGVDSVDGQEYLPVCADDRDRLVSEFGKVVVPLITTWYCSWCGVESPMSVEHPEC